MQPKVRSLPITIIDFLAIFLPGFVWLLLFIATFYLIESTGSTSKIFSLRAIYDSISSDVSSFGIWKSALLMLIFSLLIGNILKPITMETSEKVLYFVGWLHLDFFLEYLFKWYIEFNLLNEQNKKIEEPNKQIRLSKLKFPFDELYSNTEYYRKVKIELKKKINYCNPDNLSGHKLFSVTKRYIRFISPALWEESERMEAEVRMTGALFLASIYSTFLFITILILDYKGNIILSDKLSIKFWLVISFLASIILVVGWTHLRHNEVAYTYMNALIAINHPPPKDLIATNERDDD